VTADAPLEEFLVRLPADHLGHLRARAAEADRSVAAEIRRAVRQYLGEER
jgi:plasmid stability protein